MLDQRRRRWANIKSILFQCAVFAGITGGLRRFVDILGSISSSYTLWESTITLAAQMTCVVEPLLV